MRGPFIIRIVLADGVARYLFQSKYLSQRGTRYKHLSSARTAARRYIGDGKRLGIFYVDIIDDNDHERKIDL
jgi:hypothetical protein